MSLIAAINSSTRTRTISSLSSSLSGSLSGSLSSSTSSSTSIRRRRHRHSAAFPLRRYLPLLPLFVSSFVCRRSITSLSSAAASARNGAATASATSRPPFAFAFAIHPQKQTRTLSRGLFPGQNSHGISSSSSSTGSSNFLSTMSPAMPPAMSPAAATAAGAIDSTLPKAETGILDLWSKSPEADGRGIVIGIMDSGCDLAAAGLQIASTGQPKYIDFLDCSGDGDVDMAKTANITRPEDAAGPPTVKGLSGRTLKLSPDWLPESATELHLGAVRLFDIIPGTVARRVRTERKTYFQTLHHTSTCSVQDQIKTLEEAAKGKDASKLQLNDAKTLLEQLTASMEDYDDAGPLMDVISFKDASGVWRAVLDLNADGDLTGTPAMAAFAVDRQMGTLGFGSAVTYCFQFFEDGKLLSIVTDGGSHGTHVAGIAAANFDDPNAAAASTDGDATAPVPNPKNGVAPGAQLVGLKIGDGRVDTTETGTALVRGLITAKKYNCHLVNLSYGEPSWQPDNGHGRVAQTFADAVYKWGMTVFTSAGNNGPALSTVGSPGGITAPITVGAYVSPPMMREQYSTLPLGDDADKPDEAIGLRETSYSFTSRGPTPDGAFPDICAPGGAIAPIPRHTLQGKAQKHGTSMSSPNACGVAACVLSAVFQKLKAAGGDGEIIVNPNELKRALLNTAKPVDVAEPFGQGMGLISAVDAVDYILQHHGKQGQDTNFEVAVLSRGNSNTARGIYIRNAPELQHGPMTFDVRVTPRFQHAMQRTEEEVDEIVNLELDMEFKVQSYIGDAVDWVSCPDHMTLLSGRERGQSFAVRIDPTKLSPGVHYAKVQAIETKDPARGALFSVPVTVIVPHNMDATTGTPGVVEPTENEFDLTMPFLLKPGIPERRFITVPQGVEYAILKIRKPKSSKLNKGPHRIIVHTIPFTSTDVHHDMVQSKRYLTVREDDMGNPLEVKLRARGGATLEVCIQLSWLSNPEPVELDTTLEFHSYNFKAAPMFATHALRIGSSTEFARTEVGAPLRTEMINPKATLKSVHRTIRPKKCTISTALPDRDVLLPSDAEVRAAPADEPPVGTLIHQAHLDYEFELDANDMSVTPRLASLFFQLYDSPIDSQLWALKDCNGQILQYGGAMHDSSAVTLKKGKYSLNLLLRHPERAVLDALKDIPMRLMFDLKGSNALDCSVYSEFDAASTPAVTAKQDKGIIPRKAVGKRTMKRGTYKSLYVSRPTGKMPTWIQPGDVMTGTFYVDKDNALSGMSLIYELPPKPAKKSDDKSSSSSSSSSSSESKKDEDDEAKDAEALEKAIFEAKLKHLKTLRSKSEAYAKLSDALKEEKPNDLSLRKELLEYAKSAKKPEDVEDEDAWRAGEIATVVDALTAEGGPIDTAKLAQYFGCNSSAIDEDEEEDSEETKKAKELKKEMDDQRKTLRSALYKKASALGKAFMKLKSTEGSADADVEAANEKFVTAMKECKVWVSGASDLSGDEEKEGYALLSAQLDIAKGKPAAALAGLRKALKDMPASSKKRKEVSRQVIELYRTLGLEHWAENWENTMFQQFPVTSQTL